jgi:serine/threonine-protein kinase
MGPAITPGDVVAGKYRVERVLGQGGMGVVLAAQHLQLDTKVALKLLLPEALGNSEAVARFLREARAAVRIHSEHVARVLDVGTLEDGAPYIVMEYLEGSDLSALLKTQGPLVVQQAVDFVLQACEAVADAHALGIVHRDLKPANLFCIRRSDGGAWIKVLDFGISKLTAPGEVSHAMTSTSALMGSPLYMSPEQMLASKGVDIRTDIWALGVILFELLAGRPPFIAETVTELAIRVASQPAPPLGSIRRDVPGGLERVVARCLEKDRAARFANVAELAAALEGFGSGAAKLSVERILGTLGQSGNDRWSGVLSSSSPEVKPTGQMTQTAPSSWGHTTGGTGASRKTLVVIGVAAAALGLAIAGVLFALARSASTPVASITTASGSPAAIAPAPPLTAGIVAAVAPSTTEAPPPAPPTLLAPEVTPSAAQPPSRAQVSSTPHSSPGMASTGHTSTPSVFHPKASSAPPPAAPAPSPRPACDPPYVIDSMGDRQYKPECL